MEQAAGAVVRAGDVADIEAVLGLWRVAEGRPSATDSADALERLLQRDPDALLVAQLDDEVVGALIVGWDGWRGSFYRLAVHPGHRRRGIATALARAGEERLRQLGAIRLTAIVATEEPAAESFWVALGYARQGDVGRFIRMLGPAL